MVHRVLVSCSFVCCTLLIASFGFFAADQVSGASSQQVAQLNSGSPTPISQSAAKHHGPLQNFVARAAKDLTYPFHSLVQSSSQWENEIIVLVLGLAVYGVGLGYLTRFTSGLALRR